MPSCNEVFVQYQQCCDLLKLVTLELSTEALKPDSLDLYPRSKFNEVSCELHMAVRTTRIALLDWNSSTVLHAVSCNTACRSRQCRGKVLFESGSLICIGFGSKVPCREPQCEVIPNAMEQVYLVGTAPVTKDKHVLCSHPQK